MKVIVSLFHWHGWFRIHNKSGFSFAAGSPSGSADWGLLDQAQPPKAGFPQRYPGIGVLVPYIIDLTEVLSLGI